MTRTEQLKALAEAAAPGVTPLKAVLLAVDWHAYRIEATPQVVKALCELVEQLGAALRYHAKQTRPIQQTTEVLAAFERFQKGE